VYSVDGEVFQKSDVIRHVPVLLHGLWHHGCGSRVCADLLRSRI
jgi:hypothetical protein